MPSVEPESDIWWRGDERGKSLKKKKRYNMFGVDWSKIWGKGRQRLKKKKLKRKEKKYGFSLTMILKATPRP